MVIITQGKYGEAEPLYESAHVYWAKVLGSDHPDVALAMNNRAVVVDDQVRTKTSQKNVEGFVETHHKERF